MSTNLTLTTPNSPSSVTDFTMVPFSSSTRTKPTEKERMEYLEYLDAKKWPYIYPVIIYLLLLMIIGIIGNIIVLVVYKKRFKPSINRFFILTLATLDLITCLLSIPGVIIELRYDYTFFFPALCRIFRASRMWIVLVSTYTLAIVAVDRYRKVCHPLKPQYTIKSARLSLLAVNIVAVIFTVLGGVVGGRRTVKTDKEDITGSNCSYDDEFIGKAITKFYSIAWFIQSILCVTVFILLYSLIGRTIWKHRKFQFGESTDTSASSTSTLSTISSGEQNNGSKFNSLPSSKIKSPRGPPTRSTNKTAFTMFIVTVVFIMSWLPFLILVALNMYAQKWLIKRLNGYTFTIYKIFFHSYHINNVVNCYIYCFFNPQFRNECRQVLCGQSSKNLQRSSTLAKA